VITDQQDLLQSTQPGYCSSSYIAFLPALRDVTPLEQVLGILSSTALLHLALALRGISAFKLVSAQVSTAIIYSQTLRQVQSLVEERTAQLQGSLEVQDCTKTRQQVDQLRQLNHLKDEFIDSLSHELKTL